MLKEITTINFVWQHCFTCTFPVLMKEKLELDNFDKNAIDWKTEIKRNFLVLSAFKTIVTSMNENKETGNTYFKKQEYKEAISYYKTALNLAKQKENEDEIEKTISNDQAFFNLKYDYLKIMTILLSNSAMANIKLENWSTAICTALKGSRILNRLKSLIDDEDKFEKDFGQLEEKIKYRMVEARRNQGWHMRFCHHSDEKEEGLAVGTIIEHIDYDISDRGIFS